MRLSCVVLRRGNQQVVLQGMIHIGPDKLYEGLQQDIDWAAKNGYQIFFEGIKKDLPPKTSTNNERKMRKFFLLLFDLYPVLAESLGISLQKEKIRYPKEAINADVTFSELTKQLDKNGFRCNFLLWLFGLVPKRKLKKNIKEDLAKRGGLNALMDKSEGRSLGTLIFWFLFRKAIPIILDYRNKIAVARVRAHSINGRSIFIHYGEKHVKDLMGLLQKDGWVVEEITFVDLAEFC